MIFSRAVSAAAAAPPCAVASVERTKAQAIAYKARRTGSSSRKPGLLKSACGLAHEEIDDRFERLALARAACSCLLEHGELAVRARAALQDRAGVLGLGEATQGFGIFAHEPEQLLEQIAEGHELALR